MSLLLKVAIIGEWPKKRLSNIGEITNEKEKEKAKDQTKD